MAKEAKFKPLLFTTTIRNPERVKFFIYVISQFEGQIMDDNLATKIVAKAIQFGLYRPMKKTDDIKEKWKFTDNGEFAKFLLSSSEVKWILENNPQQHKEAGYSKGWPSRFQTEFLFPNQLGLVYYKPGRKVHVTDLGKKLLDCFEVNISEEGIISYNENKPQNEQLVFIQAMAKYQRCNPFLRVLNDNVPLLLLLNVIKKLDSNSIFNDHAGKPKGISRKELPLLIFWKDNDAQALYERVVKLRRDYGYDPSDEVICDICTKEIMDDDFKKFKPKSIMQEYPDEFIRKMRITGLISLRGGGRFIDINTLEKEKVDYVLSHYSQYHHYTDCDNYFEYASSLDKNLFKLKTIEVPLVKSENLLTERLKSYDWSKIKKELTILAKHNTSTDPELKFISAPARLEFLTALSIKSQMENVRVIPGYSCDDTGLPTSTAGGNQADIECFEDKYGIIVEVTMAEGRTQTMMEVWPITRHLEDFGKKYNLDSNHCEAIFTAPSIFTDSRRQIEYVKYAEKRTIRPYTIEGFVKFLEGSKNLKAVK